ncbi:MAG: hypothetical protein ACPG31_02320 [Planctomycetota bacterium]
MKRLLPLLLLAACSVSIWYLMQDEDGDSTGGAAATVVEVTESDPEVAEADLEDAPDAGSLERAELTEAETAPVDATTESESTDLGADLHLVGVRVVSPEGVVKAGVPVVLMYDALWGPQELARAETDEKGMALLLEQYIYGPKEEVRAMSIGFPFHCKDASEPVTFTSDAWPEEMIELELPATGGVEIHLLDQDGELWTNEVELKMAPVSMFSKKGKVLREKSMANLGLMVQDGIAIFPHVGLGRRLEIGIPWDPWATWDIVRVAGPKEPGEWVKVELRVKEVRPQWSVRLLFEDGTPLAERDILLQRSSWKMSDGQNFSSSGYIGTYWTDKDGNLKFPFSEALTADHEEMQFTAGPTGDARFGYAKLELLSTYAGQDQDFGDLTLAGTTLLAAGTVQDASGNPLEANVLAYQAEYHPLDADAAPDFDWAPGSNTEHGDAGAFRTFGVSNSPTIRLTVSAEGFAEKQVTVDRGSEGVSIVLQTDLGIAGRMQVPAGLNPRDTVVRFLADGEPRQFDQYRGQYPDAIPNEEGEFRIAEIPERVPGAVAVIDRESGLMLALVESVVPTMLGEVGDARLDPLILDGVHSYQVKIVGPNGGKIRGFTWMLEYDFTVMQDHGNYDFGDDFTFLWTEERATVSILANGYRITTAELKPGENTVEILRAPLVMFEAPDLPTLPDGLRYSIELDSLDGSDLLDLDTNLPSGAAGGVFPVPMPGTGDFQVKLSVWNRETGASAEVLVDGEPWVFDFHIQENATGQKIAVPLPVDGIQAAMKEAQALGTEESSM